MGAGPRGPVRDFLDPWSGLRWGRQGETGFARLVHKQKLGQGFVDRAGGNTGQQEAIATPRPVS